MNDNLLTVIERVVNNQEEYRSLLESNEAQTRWLLIDDFILSGLCYTRSDVISEYGIDTPNRVSKYNSLDYCVMRDKKPKLLIEAKSLGTNLYEYVEQLKGYYDDVVQRYEYKENELFGVLTDGDLYLFFIGAKDSKKMNTLPFFTIKLSISEECERLKLRKFSKEYIEERELPLFEEDCELKTFYRIDEIANALNYFRYKGERVCIDKVSIKGKTYTNIKSFRTLYKKLLTEINILYPEVLYQLCILESNEENSSVLRNLKYSFNKRNSNDICIKTNVGEVFFSVDNDESNLIHRIIYVLKASHYGLFNVSVALKNV